MNLRREDSAVQNAKS